MKTAVAVVTVILSILLLVSPALAAAPGAATVQVASVSVWTSLAGNGGVFLYVPDNSTGVLVYPTWHADFTTSANATYAIYVNGLEVNSGSVVGAKGVTFNVSGATATVLIGFAGVTHQYNDEVVASVAVQTGGAPPPQYVYTAQEFAQALATGQIQAYAILLLAFFGSFFMARKIVILNKQSRAGRLL